MRWRPAIEPDPLAGRCAELEGRVAELEAALREDHDTFAHMRNEYPFTQGDPMAEWDGVIRKRVEAIRALVAPIT